MGLSVTSDMRYLSPAPRGRRVGDGSRLNGWGENEGPSRPAIPAVTSGHSRRCELCEAQRPAEPAGHAARRDLISDFGRALPASSAHSRGDARPGAVGMGFSNLIAVAMGCGRSIAWRSLLDDLGDLRQGKGPRSFLSAVFIRDDLSSWPRAATGTSRSCLGNGRLVNNFGLSSRPMG